MENKKHTCYEVKLNRFFNILSFENIIWFAVLSVFPIAYWVFNLIKNTFVFKEFIVICCGCFIIIVVKLLSHPKCLDVTPNTIKFHSRVYLLNLLIIGRLWGNGSESKYEAALTLYNIKSIEYLQSSFEKMFNHGHIRICADVNMGAKGKEQRTFLIYGIKDFENTSAWMKEFVQLSNNT